MATVATHDLTLEQKTIQDLVKTNESLTRQLNAERNWRTELVQEKGILIRRLGQTIRKSKGRRRAIKQLEVALLRERAKK